MRAACYPGAVAQQGEEAGVNMMADDRDARIAQLVAENAAQREEVERLQMALAADQAQRAALAEVLSVMAMSPTNLQEVLDAITDGAVRLCDAEGALVQHVVDGQLYPLAWSGVRAEDFRERRRLGTITGYRPTARTVSGRAMLERRTVTVDDLAEAVKDEFPDAVEVQARTGQRSGLTTPLLSKGEPIGLLALHRYEVRPFSEQQVALVEAFADQAVVAIENARLFEELQSSNRDLSEALEQQTATADILRVIASSPTDLHQVLDGLVQSAVRLCGADTAPCCAWTATRS